MATIYIVASTARGSAGQRRGRNCATPAFRPPFRRSVCPSRFESRLLALPHPRAALTCAIRESEARRLDTAADSPSLSPERLACPQKAFSESVCLFRGVHLYIAYI